LEDLGIGFGCGASDGACKVDGFVNRGGFFEFDERWTFGLFTAGGARGIYNL
jgi:hypothetical protein